MVNSNNSDDVNRAVANVRRLHQRARRRIPTISRPSSRTSSAAAQGIAEVTQTLRGVIGRARGPVRLDRSGGCARDGRGHSRGRTEPRCRVRADRRHHCAHQHDFPERRDLQQPSPGADGPGGRADRRDRSGGHQQDRDATWRHSRPRSRRTRSRRPSTAWARLARRSPPIARTSTPSSPASRRSPAMSRASPSTCRRSARASRRFSPRSTVRRSGRRSTTFDELREHASRQQRQHRRHHCRRARACPPGSTHSERAPNCFSPSSTTWRAQGTGGLTRGCARDARRDPRGGGQRSTRRSTVVGGGLGRFQRSRASRYPESRVGGPADDPAARPRHFQHGTAIQAASSSAATRFPNMTAGGDRGG